MDLLPVYGPNPARHVPFATVLGTHDDAVMFIQQYPALYIPNDTTVGSLYSTYVYVYI